MAVSNGDSYFNIENSKQQDDTETESHELKRIRTTFRNIPSSLFNGNTEGKDEKEQRSSNKIDKKRGISSTRNAPPELIHYLKDRHGPKAKNSNSPPQLLPEVIVTRTKLNKERPQAGELSISNKRLGKSDDDKHVAETVDSDGKPLSLQENIKMMSKLKKKSNQKAMYMNASSDECSQDETTKQGGHILLCEALLENVSVVEIQRRLMLELQKQKKSRLQNQHEKFKKTNNKMANVICSVQNVSPNLSMIGNGSVVMDENLNYCNLENDHNTLENTQSLRNASKFVGEEKLGSESSCDIHEINSVLDFEEWITEEEVDDVIDDDDFVTPQHVSTGKEERDTIDGIEFLSFETEHDMVEFTKIELDFKGVTMLDDGITQSDDGLDMMDDSFAFSESETQTVSQAIVPTKTKDITKIKGWRTKQFAVNNNPVHAHCSNNSNGPYDDDDGFGSCDVKLGDDLSLDVNEDPACDKWYSEEQESSNMKSAEVELKTDKGFIDADLGTEQEKVKVKEKGVTVSHFISGQDTTELSECTARDKENAKNFMNNATTFEKVTRNKIYKFLKLEPVNSPQLNTSMHVLQKQGHKPKTLAEKRMMMELEQKKKNLNKQQKYLRSKKQRGRPKKQSNSLKKDFPLASVVTEEKDQTGRSFRKSSRLSAMASNCNKAAKQFFHDKNHDGKYQSVCDMEEKPNNLYLSGEHLGKENFHLDENYKYIWDAGRPIRLGGSRKNIDHSTKETAEPLQNGQKVSVEPLDEKCDKSGPEGANEMKCEKSAEKPAAGNVSVPGNETETYNTKGFEYGLVVSPTIGKPLVPLARSQLDLLRANSQYIDEHWAKFAVSVVVSRDWRKNPLPRNRIVLPMRSPCLPLSVAESSSAFKISRSDVNIPLKHNISLPGTHTGLRLIRPMGISTSNTNVLAPRLGPMGCSSVRMRCPKPPTQIGIRTIPGSVRLNPIASGIKEPSCVSNNSASIKHPAQKNTVPLQKTQQKFKVSNWKNKLSHLIHLEHKNPEDEVTTSVRSVVNDMVDYVILREMGDGMIKDDPDVIDFTSSDNHVTPPKINKKRKAMVRELNKLDVTVIDMDMHGTAEEESGERRSIICNQEFCKLGCVCGSLQACKSLVPEHCGLVQCMFGCHCDIQNSAARSRSKPCVLSEETILNLQNKNVRFLAKEEKEFRHTVIRAKDEMIVVGGDGTVRRKREIKLPGRYRDSYITLGVGLGEHKLMNEENTDTPKRMARSLSTPERGTVMNQMTSRNISKKASEKKPSPVKESCNLKDCHVQLQRLHIPDGVLPLCMDHSSYNCHCCKNISSIETENTIGNSHTSKSGILYMSSGTLKERNIEQSQFIKLTPELLNRASSSGPIKLTSNALSSSSPPKPDKTVSLLKPNLQENKRKLYPLRPKPIAVSSPSSQLKEADITQTVQGVLPQHEALNNAKLVKQTAGIISVQETCDQPLLNQNGSKTRNVAVKSTTLAYGHIHDVYRHSARTAPPGINYCLRNRSHFFLRKQARKITGLEMMQRLYPGKSVDLSCYLYLPSAEVQHPGINLVKTNTDINTLCPSQCSEMNKWCGDDKASTKSLNPNESSEVIGKIESVTSLSEEEYRQVKPTIDCEMEGGLYAVDRHVKTKDPSMHFLRMPSGLLQFVETINSKGNIKSITVKQLDALLKKVEHNKQREDIAESPGGNWTSVYLLHFSLLMERFKQGHIHLWFSKESGAAPKLLMTASAEKPSPSYLNLNEIPEEEYERLPTLVADMLQRPSPHLGIPKSNELDQKATYVLLCCDGKSVELGEATSVSKSWDEFVNSGKVLTPPDVCKLSILTQPASSEKRMALEVKYVKSKQVPLSKASDVISETGLGDKLVLPSSNAAKIFSLSSNSDDATIEHSFPKVPSQDNVMNVLISRIPKDADDLAPTHQHNGVSERSEMVFKDKKGVSPKDEVESIINSKPTSSTSMNMSDVKTVTDKKPFSKNVGIKSINQKPSLVTSERISVGNENHQSLLHCGSHPFTNTVESQVLSDNLLADEPLPNLNAEMEFINNKRKIASVPRLKTGDSDHTSVSDFETEISGNEPLSSSSVVLGTDIGTSGITVQISLPSCSIDSRWYVVSLCKKFDFLLSVPRRCSVRYDQVLEAINLSNQQKETVCLPFEKPDSDNSKNKSVISDQPKFGIYAVSGITSHIFIGPYMLSEDANITLCKVSNGKVIEMTNNDYKPFHLKSEKSREENSNPDAVQVVSHVTRVQSIIEKSKCVWLYTAGEKYIDKNDENCKTDLKSSEAAEKASKGTASTANDNAKEHSRRKQILEIRNCGGEDKITLEKLLTVKNSESSFIDVSNTPFISNVHSVASMGVEENFSDNEELDIETVSDDCISIGSEKFTIKKAIFKSECSSDGQQYVSVILPAEGTSDRDFSENVPTSTRTSMLEIKSNAPILSIGKAVSNSLLKSSQYEMIKKTKLRPILPAPLNTVTKAPSRSVLFVKLVPSMPNIGYINASYDVDGTISFLHPCAFHKMTFGNLASVNQWLHRYLQSRIRYIPKELRVTWRLVSQSQELPNMHHFKSHILNGNYILTVKGIFNLKHITADRAIKYGLKEKHVIHLQTKRKQHDLQDGFQCLRKAIMDSTGIKIKSKYELLIKASEEIFNSQERERYLTTSVLEEKMIQGALVQKLGSAMRSIRELKGDRVKQLLEKQARERFQQLCHPLRGKMSVAEKKETLRNMSRILQQKDDVVLVDLDSETEPKEAPDERSYSRLGISDTSDLKRLPSVIDIASSDDSDIADYMTDNDLPFEEEHSNPRVDITENIPYIRSYYVGNSKWNTNASEDSSVSISLVSEEQTSETKTTILESTDDVTVTCIPVASPGTMSSIASQKDDSLFPKSKTLSPEIGISSNIKDRCNISPTRSENCTFWNRSIPDHSTNQRNMHHLADVTKATYVSSNSYISSSSAKRKALDDDIVIVQSSNKRLNLDDSVNGNNVKKIPLHIETSDVISGPGIKKTLSYSETNDTGGTNVQRSVHTKPIDSSVSICIPQSHLLECSDSNKQSGLCVKKLPLVSELNDVHNSAISPSNKYKTIMIGKSNTDSLAPTMAVKLAPQQGNPNVYPRGINLVSRDPMKRVTSFKIISGKIEHHNPEVPNEGNRNVARIAKVHMDSLKKSVNNALVMKVAPSAAHQSLPVKFVDTTAKIRDMSPSDLGLNFIKTSNTSATTPAKMSFPSAVQSVNVIHSAGNLVAHSKPSLQYIYSGNGGKMYVKGPSGRLPLILATRSVPSEDSKRSVTLTMSNMVGTTSTFVNHIVKPSPPEVSASTITSDGNVNIHKKSVLSNLSKVHSPSQGLAIQPATRTSTTVVPALVPLVGSVTKMPVVIEKKSLPVISSIGNSPATTLVGSEMSKGNIVVRKVNLEKASSVTQGSKDGSSQLTVDS